MMETREEPDPSFLFLQRSKINSIFLKYFSHFSYLVSFDWDLGGKKSEMEINVIKREQAYSPCPTLCHIFMLNMNWQCFPSCLIILA